MLGILLMSCQLHSWVLVGLVMPATADHALESTTHCADFAWCGVDSWCVKRCSVLANDVIILNCSEVKQSLFLHGFGACLEMGHLLRMRGRLILRFGRKSLHGGLVGGAIDWLMRIRNVTFWMFWLVVTWQVHSYSYFNSKLLILIFIHLKNQTFTNKLKAD